MQVFNSTKWNVMSSFRWNDTLLKARLKLPCVSWAWFSLTVIPVWDMFFYSRRKSCGFRNAVSLRLCSAAPRSSWWASVTRRAHLSRIKRLVQERGQEAWAVQPRHVKIQERSSVCRSPKTMLIYIYVYIYVYVYIYMFLFMCMCPKF